MGKLFGGGSKSQSVSNSYNRAYPFIRRQFGGLTSQANNGVNALQALLSGDMSGLNTFLDTTGFDFARDRGESALNTKLASQGMRNSGAALKALIDFNQDLRSQYSGNYLDTLLKQIGVGFNAGQLISGAGNTANSQSTSSSSSKGGIGSTIGSVAGAIAKSDPRLKMNIKKLGEYIDGLGWYEYEYKDNPGVKQRGVMADEVQRLRPWALGPELEGGYLTVDYSKLSKKG
jgi:Chaperone of endosialidase